MTLHLALLDPVPGPIHEDEYWLQELTTRRSTLIVSINAGQDVAHLYGFKPQVIYGARRVIISRKDHGVGYHIGVIFKDQKYKASKLNELPAGFYISVTRNPLPTEPEEIVLCPFYENVEKFTKEVFPWWAPDTEGRRKKILQIAEYWFHRTVINSILGVNASDVPTAAFPAQREG